MIDTSRFGSSNNSIKQSLCLKVDVHIKRLLLHSAESGAQRRRNNASNSITSNLPILIIEDSVFFIIGKDTRGSPNEGKTVY